MLFVNLRGSGFFPIWTICTIMRTPRRGLFDPPSEISFVKPRISIRVYYVLCKYNTIVFDDCGSRAFNYFKLSFCLLADASCTNKNTINDRADLSGHLYRICILAAFRCRWRRRRRDRSIVGKRLTASAYYVTMNKKNLHTHAHIFIYIFKTKNKQKKKKPFRHGETQNSKYTHTHTYNRLTTIHVLMYWHYIENKYLTCVCVCKRHRRTQIRVPTFIYVYLI